jgi:PAS domain S-box-containing protein
VRGPAEDRLAPLTSYAARLLGAPFAQVSLLAGTQQIVAAAHGFALTDDNRQGPLADGLCTVTAAYGAPLAVNDAREDPWVRDLPPVQSGAVGSYLGTVLTDPAGRVLGSLCVYDTASRSWTSEQVVQLSDVAELISAELERHATSAKDEVASVRARLAVDAAELGSFVYDFATPDLVDWDERMMALHGIGADSFDGTITAFQAAVHPADLPAVQAAFAHARDTLGEMASEYRTVLPGGEIRWVRIRGRAFPDMLGAPARVLGAAYDASSDRELRDELTRLMETMPAALVRIDRDWTLTFVNANAEALYGRSRHELVGQHVWVAFPEAQGSAFQDAYERAMSTGEPGVMEAYFAPLDAHFEVRIWPDEQGLTLFFQDVSERARARAVEKEVGRRLAVLADAGSRLGGSLRPLEVLEVLADIVVPELGVSLSLAVTDAVAELLGLPAGNDPTRIHPILVRHQDPGTEAELRAVIAALELRTTEANGVGLAVATGRPASYPRVPDDFLRARAVDDEHYVRMQRLNTGPQLTVPLTAPGGVLGAFTVAGKDGHPPDEVLILDLARRSAIALESALSFARQHQAATVLQRALLPRTAPTVPDVQVATRYLPASAHALAGGDFFKTVEVDGRLVCALGDVMGHGTASAARAGQLHGLVAALALQGMGPAELLTRLGAGIDQMMDLELATLLVSSYDPRTRRLTTATAGHPPPLFAPVHGQPYYLDLEPGAPIGVMADTYVELTCELEAGATTVLFSDGLVERRGESIDDGLERLRQAVNELRLPPEAVADHVLRMLGAEDGGDDDIALLVLSHL